MRALRLIALLALAPLSAQADEVALLDWLGGQGCAIGPGTAEAATEAGFDASALEALGADGAPQGAWRVLPAELCTIRLPEIESEITLEDAWPHLSDPGAFLGWSDYGCFLDPLALTADLIETRGWSEDRAFTAYISLLGKGIAEGEWGFYATSMLRTPVGPQYIGSADCALGVTARTMRANHAHLAAQFGPFLREIAPLVECAEGETASHYTGPQLLDRLTEGQNTNAWMSFEMSLVTMGAGWIEGMTYREKGTPRPPVCHFPD